MKNRLTRKWPFGRPYYNLISGVFHWKLPVNYQKFPPETGVSDMYSKILSFKCVWHDKCLIPRHSDCITLPDEVFQHILSSFKRLRWAVVWLHEAERLITDNMCIYKIIATVFPRKCWINSTCNLVQIKFSWILAHWFGTCATSSKSLCHMEFELNHKPPPQPWPATPIPPLPPCKFGTKWTTTTCRFDRNWRMGTSIRW